MGNFDIKSFMINEGLTRVSRERKKLLKEYLTITVDDRELDSRNPDETIDYVEQRYGYRPDKGDVNDFFNGFEYDTVTKFIEDQGKVSILGDLDDYSEEMFDLYFNPERGNNEGWGKIIAKYSNK